MAKIYVLQHHPGRKSRHHRRRARKRVRSHGNTCASTTASRCRQDMKGAGGLIVMGGPMGVYQTDRYPWLRDEMR